MPKTYAMRQNFFLLFFIILALSSGLRAQNQAPPNIILIVVDDLGWQDVGFNGSTYYETPVLDKLAQKSIVFNQAYSGAANCAPSRACLISGQNTPRHGIYTVGSSERGKVETRKIIPVKNTTILAEEQTTLPEVLQNHGYTTATMGKWHLSQNPLTQGFDINIGGNLRGHPKSYFSPYQNPDLPDGPPGEYLTDRLTDEAITFIDQHKDQPFFLYLPYFTIHTPLQGKDSLVQYYKNKVPKDGQGRNPNYGAMVTTMDENIGRIINRLELQGLSNTLFIFTSDNGALAYLSDQSPLRAGKGSYYEGGIRVPLFFYWPSQQWEPTRHETPVVNLDLYPTLLELVNLPVPAQKQLDGKSLASLIQQGNPLAKRPLFWHFPIYLQAYKKGQDGSRDPLFRTRPGSVVRYGKWKLHEYFEDGGLELYKLNKDPGEKHNLSTRRKQKAQKLHRLLQAWRKETEAAVPTKINPKFDPNTYTSNQ